MPEDLKIIQKHYDLLMWAIPQISKYPRSHRFSLGLRIENNLYEILDGLIEARFSKIKREILKKLNIKLEQLRFQFRISKDLKFLSIRQYDYVTKAVNEVGVLLGAWVKQCKE